MHTVLRPSPTARASTSDDGLVLLDLDGGLVLSANQVGGRIWALIEGQHTPAQIASRLAAEYAIGEDRALDDVLAFVDALRARNLVIDAEVA